MRAVADFQPAAHARAGLLQLANFLLQRHRIEHYTVSDRRHLIRTNDPGRKKLEHILLRPHQDRVTGVGASLVSGNDIKVFRQDIDHLALALITPLNSQYHHIG